EDREMIEEVGRLFGAAGGVAGHGRQRQFDAFFADLLGNACDALLEELARITRFAVFAAFAGTIGDDRGQVRKPAGTIDELVTKAAPGSKMAGRTFGFGEH